VSTDPSPWAELGGTLPEPDIIEPTAVLVEQDQQEQALIRLQEFHDERLWERYAHRLTANGSLIR
jgi:hypothetical protein